MFDPQPAVVQGLVGELRALPSAPGRGFLVGMRIATSGKVNARKPRSCNNPLPSGNGYGVRVGHALVMHTAAIGVTEKED